MSMCKKISKGTRFSVFKRDGFTCQYCGAYPYGGKKAFLYFCGVRWNRIRAAQEGGANA